VGRGLSDGLDGRRQRGVTRRIDLLAADEMADGELTMAWVDGGASPVLVVRTGGSFRAFQGTCSHEYFELDRGFLTAGSLTCPLHLSRFDLADGEALDPPASLPLAVYPVVVEGGRVLIEVPDGPLELNAD
jgi:3-phenylpropionate/trans-cinnamate dioxygenase ferredoxin component